MARKKMTEEELAQFNRENRLKEKVERLIFCSEPTYKFKIGDSVLIGNLKNCVVKEALHDNKIYLIEYTSIDNNYGKPIIKEGQLMYVMWYEIRPITLNDKSLVQNRDFYLQFYSMQVSSLFSKYYHFGLDLEPKYQRDFVWSKSDKVALIDSIFNNVEIGKFAIINKPWHNKYAYEVLDGKQRIRALLDFYENRFKYKGFYFNELSRSDQEWFKNFPITVAITEDDLVNNLKYFLLLNTTGKKVNTKHIEKVRELYDAVTKNYIISSSKEELIKYNGKTAKIIKLSNYETETFIAEIDGKENIELTIDDLKEI